MAYGCPKSRHQTSVNSLEYIAKIYQNESNARDTLGVALSQGTGLLVVNRLFAEMLGQHVIDHGAVLAAL